MKNKKILSICIIAVIGFASFMLMPYVHAAYDCPIQYAGDTSINGNNASQPAATDHDQLVACCYQAAKEPFGGVSCRPIDKFLQQLGSAIKCETTANLTAIAETQQNANKLNFNCFTGATPATCRDGWCMLTGTCTKQTGYSCPQGSPYRQDICPGGCGSCLPDYVYCPGNVATDPGTCTTAIDCANQNHVCQAKQYGPGVYSESAAGSCKNLGKDVANYCDGTCTGCAAGYTESGRTLGACISFAQRFIEIFEDGLTWLGGIQKTIPVELYAGGKIDKMQAIYDYTPTTTKEKQDDVYLKADIAGNLDWSNQDIPPSIRQFVNNYTTCDFSKGDADCLAGQFCGTDGLCHGSGALNSACTNSSQCSYGLYCEAGLCVKNALMPGPLFVGLTAFQYDGSRGGYKTANDLCISNYSGSHICTSDEIINSYVVNATTLSGVSGSAWINHGPPAYINYVANDCNGWADNSNGTIFATLWNFTNKNFKVATCNLQRKFACCK